MPLIASEQNTLVAETNAGNISLALSAGVHLGPGGRPLVPESKGVFEIDLVHCPNCGGELRIISAILEQLGLPAPVPPRASARAPKSQASMTSTRACRFRAMRRRSLAQRISEADGAGPWTGPRSQSSRRESL